MAWNVKVPPAEVLNANVKATFSIDLEKGTAGRIVLSYTDEDGLPYGRPRNFILAVDGVTITDVDRNQELIWTPPANSAARFSDTVKYLTEGVEALINQGLATPKR